MKSNTSILFKRTIILTGATGVVGSHVLYELLLQIKQGKFQGNIILLVRANIRERMSGYDRVVCILSEKFVPDYLKIYKVDELLSHIQIVE